MTPQPRHIEAAEKIVYAFMDDPNKISVRGDLTPMIARALAEAENRAAWDVVKMAHATWAIPLDLIDSVAREVTAKYGPRQAKENKL